MASPPQHDQLGFRDSGRFIDDANDELLILHQFTCKLDRRTHDRGCQLEYFARCKHNQFLEVH